MAASWRRRKILGVPVASDDGVIWTWWLDHHRYSWCKAGWCVRQSAALPFRLLFSKTLEGAVGYTMGLHDGLGYAQRANVEGVLEGR